MDIYFEDELKKEWSKKNDLHVYSFKEFLIFKLKGRQEKLKKVEEYCKEQRVIISTMTVKDTIKKFCDELQSIIK
jgi:predicted nucleotidyltransferase